jgi:hypothetical protein
MWDESDLRRCLAGGRIEWRKHALERMFERDIRRAEILETLARGEIITAYPDDHPVPSALIGAGGGIRLHVVAALDVDNATCYVITVYRPDDEHFEPNMKTRKRQ